MLLAVEVDTKLIAPVLWLELLFLQRDSVIGILSVAVVKGVVYSQ